MMKSQLQKLCTKKKTTDLNGNVKRCFSIKVTKRKVCAFFNQEPGGVKINILRIAAREIQNKIHNSELKQNQIKQSNLSQIKKSNQTNKIKIEIKANRKI